MLRRVFEGWARGDFSVSEPLIGPDTVLVIHSDFPEWGTYVGPEQIAGYMRELMSSFDGFAIEAEEFVAEEGDRVVVAVHQHGPGKVSGVETDHRYFQVFTFSGEKWSRVESILHREDALEAAGLSG